MSKRWIILLLAGWAAAACVYPYKADLSSPEQPILVVEGNIVLGKDASLSVLTMLTMKDKPGGSYTRANVQDWWVEDDAGTVYRSAAAGGKISLQQAPAGRGYRMRMCIDGKTYSTPFQQPLPPPEIQAIDFWADQENVYANISLQSGPESSGYAALSIEEVWAFHAQFKPDYDYRDGQYVALAADELSINYWCWRHWNQNTTEQYVDYSYNNGSVKDFVFHSFGREDERNHRDYNIKVRVRSLTRDEMVYLKNLDRKAAQGNNLFSPNPGEVPGNVFCEDNPAEQVLGYVSVMDYTTATARLDKRYLVEKDYDEDQFRWVPPGLEQQYYEEYLWRPVRYYLPDDFEGRQMGWVS